MQFAEAKGLRSVGGYLRAIYTLKAEDMGADPPLTADALIQRMATHMQNRLMQLQVTHTHRAHPRDSRLPPLAAARRGSRAH